MKANELRLGNWVAVRDHFCKVVEIWSDAVWFSPINDSGHDKAAINYLTPIPLTPEILEKAGFEIADMPFTGLLGYSVRDGEAFFIGFTSENERGWRFANPHFDLVIEYLHQLQNLYFSLTGKELEIKL